MFGKFSQLANSIILEARQSELTYQERRVKDSLDAVIIIDGLSEATKNKLQALADGITTSRELIEQYTNKEKELSTEAKKYCAELFDEEDKVLTRSIVLTKDLLRFTKVVPSVKKVKDTAALEKLIKDISDLIKDQQSDLAKQLKAMIENCDYISEKMSLPAEKVLVTPPEVQKKSKKIVSEGISDFVKTIANKLTKFLDKIKSFIQKFDKKQNEISDKIKEAKAIK